jgi:ABC-type branched-subunit amino acid transport system ATPase component/branched-subunit amino acid ABC-type transport system permease component
MITIFATFQVTGPALLLGLGSGLVYGLLAVGLVIIYRSSGIINFAHGEIGLFGGAVLTVMVLQWGVPYWVAFPVGIVAAALAGGLAELIVVRRLRQAPMILTIIATLGLGAFLDSFSSALTANEQATGASFPLPAGFPSFAVGPLQVTSAYSAMLILSPVVIIGLTLFFRHGSLGRAIRASATNPELARLSGVWTNRMSTLAWMLSGGLAGFTVIFLIPTTGAQGGQILGPDLLLRALTAAVIARYVNLPVAMISGIGVGIVEEIVSYNYSANVTDVVLLAIIIVALILTRERKARASGHSSWLIVQAWPPIPESLRRVFLVRNLGRFVGGLTLVVALVLPVLLTDSNTVIVEAIISFGFIGLAIGIVSGLSGQLNLGQFAIAGVGAIVAIHVASAAGNSLIGLLAGGFGAALVSLAVGLPALRLSGPTLAVVTLALALVGEQWAFQQSWAFGSSMTANTPTLGGPNPLDTKQYYLFSVVVFTLGFILVRNLWAGGSSRRMRAVRDNEDGARAFTVSPTRVRLQAFMLSGFVAGLGGAVYAFGLGTVSGAAFPTTSSIDLVAESVLGGIAVLGGPLLGALYIIGVPDFWPFGNAGLAATSLGWLAVILIIPGGLAVVFARNRLSLMRFLARRAGADPDDEQVVGGEGHSFDTEIALATPERPSRSDPVLLEARSISKSYGGVLVLDDVSLQVNSGEVLGLIGPNGAGKTTLFEVLSGYTPPSSGKVIFAGQDVSSFSAQRRAALGIGRSFQDAFLFPTLTVRETVMLSLERSHPTRLLGSLLGINRSEQRRGDRANELIAMMGLYRYREQRIAALSTGTRRIVELSCMIALNPTLLLLDEPTSGIAQRETESLAGLLTAIKAQLQLTIVIVEHDMPMIMSLSDRIVALDTGRVIADGTPEEVRSDPLVVSSYLGGDVVAIERSSFAPSGAASIEAPERFV